MKDIFGNEVSGPFEQCNATADHPEHGKQYCYLVRGHHTHHMGAAVGWAKEESEIMKTKPERGGDYFTLDEIRRMLREANNEFDGPGPVALVRVEKEKRILPKLECVETPGATVVTLPGDGAEFPELAFAEALRAAPIIVERD